MTLAVLPRHSEATPSSAMVRLKHSVIPSYLRSRRPVFNISSCRKIRLVNATILTRSYCLIARDSSIANTNVITDAHVVDNLRRVAYPDRDTRQDMEIIWRQEEHTWFWIKSLTRSMGAAAVLETAAETPPTVIASQFLLSFVTKFPTAYNTSPSMKAEGGNE